MPDSRPLSSPAPRALVLATLFACASGEASFPETAASTADAEPPTLVVLVVVDQLRGDMVDRYGDLFHHGFRRLWQEGWVFSGASHRHANTETAVGHSTLSTGVYPARHGVVANQWEEERGGEWQGVYAVADSDSPILDVPRLSGRSPLNLRRPGLADWVAAAGEGARVVSISAKDRAAVPLAGQADGHVYWMDKPQARFVTSTRYRSEYPGWVEDFNRDVMPGLFADSVWEDRIPPEGEGRSRPDAAAYEGDGVHTTFPHRYYEEDRTPTVQGLHNWIGRGPWPDDATLGLALKAIDELDLGRRGVVDFLAVSFSQTDYIGHDYGPLSREQLDNLLRLDVVLGRLLAALDEEVGRGRWVLALSSDHGVADAPEWRAQHGLPGARLARGDRGRLRDALASAAGSGEDVVSAGEPFPFVARVYRHDDLRAGEVVDSFALLHRNSLTEGRAASLGSPFGVEVRPAEGVLFGGEARGSGHGTAYWYDRWVPLVFFGRGVPPGRSDEAVYTVDVAPTLARLAGIPAPSDLDGRALDLRGWPE